MKTITEEFEFKSNSPNGGIRILARNKNKTYKERPIIFVTPAQYVGGAFITTDEMRELAKFLIDTAEKIENDPDLRNK